MLQSYVSPHFLLWSLLLPVLPCIRSPEGQNGVESIASPIFGFHFTHFQAPGLLYSSWAWLGAGCCALGADERGLCPPDPSDYALLLWHLGRLEGIPQVPEGGVPRAGPEHERHLRDPVWARAAANALEHIVGLGPIRGERRGLSAPRAGLRLPQGAALPPRQQLGVADPSRGASCRCGLTSGWTSPSTALGWPC